jgi:SAM-dependent methyltransferase
VSGISAKPKKALPTLSKSTAEPDRQVAGAYTSKSDWDGYFSGRVPRRVESIFFSELLEPYLQRNPEKNVLEVGCAGGEYLCYFSKRYGFQPFGVDYSDEIEQTNEIFAFNGMPLPTLYKADFFNWNPGRAFDVVFSVGFIEHFEDPRPVIQKHVDLLKSKGFLIITLPHFAHAQYFLHWLIDRDNLKLHNVRIMRLGVLKKALGGLPLTLHHLDYYQTFGFWTERRTWNPLQRLTERAIVTWGKILWKIFGFRASNFLFSPQIVLIAQKT